MVAINDELRIVIPGDPVLIGLVVVSCAKLCPQTFRLGNMRRSSGTTMASDLIRIYFFVLLAPARDPHQPDATGGISSPVYKTKCTEYFRFPGWVPASRSVIDWKNDFLPVCHPTA